MLSLSIKEILIEKRNEQKVPGSQRQDVFQQFNSVRPPRHGIDQGAENAIGKSSPHCRARPHQRSDGEYEIKQQRSKPGWNI